MRTKGVVFRKPVGVPIRQQATAKTFAAPTRGWVTNENPVFTQAGAALVLENFFPTMTGARLRGGCLKHATAGTGEVQSLIAYKSGSTQLLFAAEGGKIYDITTPADTDVSPTPDVTGQTSDLYSYRQMATAGGDYLIAVNGANNHWVFDGSAWAQNTPAITGVSSSALSHVTVFKNRLWFVQKDTLNAWYLGVDSLGGAASAFSLAGVFKRGGALLFIDTWSLDAGDGIDDKIVFFSNNGEAVIYEGSYPGSASDWAMVGRYDVSIPLGRNATMQAGGDLAIACVEGLIPLSSALKKDPSALRMDAVSKPIEPDWKSVAQARGSANWQVIKWPEKNMAIISMPAALSGGQPAQDLINFVVNLQTGAWAKYTGWDVRCLAYHDQKVFFGTSDGKVMQAEATGFDDGQPYTSRYCSVFELGTDPNIKTARQMRVRWTYSQEFTDKSGAFVDYKTVWPAAPASTSSVGSSVFGYGVWGVSTWSLSASKKTKARWVSVGKTGTAFAPIIQVTNASIPSPDAEFIAVDMTFEAGSFAV